MRRRPRRSRPAARPSSASGGSSVERLPIASKKPTTASSPSRACRRASGEAQELRTRSSVCTKSSSGGLRRRPCCRRPIRRQCCSGRCSPLVKSTCARLTVGRPSPPHNKAINRLTSPPDSVLSKCRRSRQQIPTQFATAPGRGEEQGTSSKGMEVGDLPGRKCQPHQAVIGLFRHYRGGQAGGQRGPRGPVE